MKEIESIDWMHSIDLGGGVVTRGKWPRNPLIEAAFDKIDFRGKKVLDVGTCNGLWSFEAERRGAAEVHSVDFLTHVDYWCSPGYRLAHRLRNSRAQYNPDLNVYDVEQMGIRDFDVIVFCGLYYHLKHPLLALTKMRRVLKTGGVIVIEGPILLTVSGSVAQFKYSNADKDRSNWWSPTLECLRDWIQCSRFEILEELPAQTPDYLNTLGFKVKSVVKRLLNRPEFYSKRIVIRAQGVTGADPLYASIDPDLAEYMK